MTAKEVFELEPETDEYRSDWRAVLSSKIRCAVKADKYRAKIGLSEKEWEPCSSSYSPTLVRTLSKGTLAEFSFAVRETAQAVGRGPDEVKQFSMQPGSGTPMLIAKWYKHDDVHLNLWLERPIGCKLHPEKMGYAGEYAALHPECEAVLAELESL